MPIDTRVKAFISQQVDEGINSVSEVQRQLNVYVKRHLFASQPLPSRLNRRFFPTRHDISNVIFRARVANMQSRIDQDNLQAKIADWQEQNPEDKFFFRPYCESSQSCDDTDDIVLNSDGTGKGLLVV